MSIPPEAFEAEPLPNQPLSEVGDWQPGDSSETPDAEPVEGEAQAIARDVEAMTVAELLGQFFRAPSATFGALWKVLTAPPDVPVSGLALFSSSRVGVGRGIHLGTAWDALMGAAPAHPLTPEEAGVRLREGIQLGLRLAALAIALYGSGILATERTERLGLQVGAPYLLLGFVIWLGAELYGSWPSLWEWWRSRGTTPPEVISDAPEAIHKPSSAGFGISANETRPWWMRMTLAGLALAFSVLTALLNLNNLFTIPGLVAWVVSIGVWAAAFAPDSWRLGAMWAAIRKTRIHRNWTFWVLLLIMLLGAYFRFNQLATVPPEMTSDHVEKLLDSQSILDGVTRVFFTNNGGREPLQFYGLALLSGVSGLPMTFLTLKLLTVVEGLISIPLLWWMGREVIGSDDRKLGNLVGLILAGLVAVSYWHVALSRLGLRIILTVIFTALLIIFLSRALRHNRRGEYIKAGLVLGFGLYAYQAVRILPVVIVIGVGMALVFHLVGRWFGRKRRVGWSEGYILNLAVLVVISVAVFVPLLTFSLQYPDDFWRRTSGRLLGDDMVQITDENGKLVQRVATLDERLVAFRQNWPILADNMRTALLMYNWKGDVAWINAAPNRPTMDMFTGALLIVGLAAWLARMIRRRDVVDWLLPVMLVVMLLPSALSIAYPVENPSATRTSGTLPEAYLFAALPLALIAAQLMRIAPRRGMLIAAGLSAIVILASYQSNQAVYFGDYARYYTGSSLPYSDAGKVLKGFAESGGGYGNAYMIAFPYWWDHRAIGLEAGLTDWPNGIIALSDTPNFLYLASQKSDGYRLDPDRDLLFFYSIQDDETERQLKTWFPTGYAQVFQSYQPEDNFKLYRVPALGSAVFIDFLQHSGAVQ